MKTHIEVVGILNIVSSILTLLIGGAIFIVLLVVVPIANDPDAQAVLPLVSAGVALITLLFSVPSLIAGIGLLKFQSWARILGIIVAIVSLLNIPIGTIAGAYSIWVLTHQESLALLKN